MLKRVSLLAAVVASSLDVQSLSAAELEDGLKQLDAGDYSSAFTNFGKALDNQVGDAAFYLGQMYDQGIGVQQNQFVARQYYEKGRELKSPLATLSLGYLAISGGAGVLQNHANARRDICEAGQLGNSEGTFSCGRLQIEGFAGIQDVEAGLLLVEQAANSGNLEALNYLGQYYANTEKSDPVKSLEYYSRSASKFDPFALFRVGFSHENGLGTEVDLVDAHVYYNLASSLGGSQEAVAALQRVTSALTAEQLVQSQVKAAEMFEAFNQTN